MEHAQYVLTGWIVTGVALAAYAGVVITRTRRAARLTTAPAPAEESWR